MMIGTIDESQRKAARAAGFAYLLALAAVIFANFGIHDRLMVAGDAAQTARNIIAHERLFRIGIAFDLIYCASLLLIITALYAILEPIIFSNYSKVVNLWWFDSAMGIFEITMGFWLLLKGLRPSATPDSRAVPEHA